MIKTDATPIVASEVEPEYTSVRVHETWIRRQDERGNVSWFGNMLWILFAGGAVVACMYYIFGLLLCCTIVLAPFGMQLIKLGHLALLPFGKRVDSCSAQTAFGTLINTVLNMLWIPVGIFLLLWHTFMGIVCACTCYGVIFTFQHMKLAQMALFPFGARDSHERVTTETRVTDTTHVCYSSIPPSASLPVAEIS